MKRDIGENDDYICKIIREDLIDEFISYVNEKQYSLNSKVEPSIYETNIFLFKRSSTLIEYAAFFGSIKIFMYLNSNGIKLTPSLWIYGIHSNNLELIKYLENNYVKPNDKTYVECYKEAIKCHHIRIANYIQMNLLNENVILKKIENNFDDNTFSYAFHYYNYNFFPSNFSNHFIFLYACKYDYFMLVYFFL